MKPARTFALAKRAMIDVDGFREALDRVTAAEKNTSIRPRTRRARWIITVAIYNLTILGRVQCQEDVDSWLRDQWRAARAAAAPKDAT